MGGIAVPLQKRINIHRTTKSGCQYLIKHFLNDCEVSLFSIQILETFEDGGYVSGTVCPIVREIRLERECHWMKHGKYPLQGTLVQKIKIAYVGC